ncbi:MAG: LysE/ArgO family amino acid transporter [Pseudomonadota bacterium]
MTSAYAPGFLLGLSLIIVIGAQNAFVLREGIRGGHVFAVCMTCALSDAILIAAGVGGFSVLVETLPWVEPVARWGGIAFLMFYGALALRNATKGGESLEASEVDSGSLVRTIMTCLALTWLNPHVYLDTVVLLGSISTQYGDRSHIFGLGAITASFVFFFTLGYGAAILRPLFARPVAWRILDIAVALIMWGIAAKLIFF